MRKIRSKENQVESFYIKEEDISVGYLITTFTSTARNIKNQLLKKPMNIPYFVAEITKTTEILDCIDDLYSLLSTQFPKAEAKYINFCVTRNLQNEFLDRESFNELIEVLFSQKNPLINYKNKLTEILFNLSIFRRIMKIRILTHNQLEIHR